MTNFSKMINTQSIKKRFLVSIGVNVVRAIISFISILLLAKGLMPAGYGDLMFLLGSFVSIRSLLDMGSSNAFFTFISQKKQGWNFYLFYFLWLALQFIFMFLFITIFCPQSLIERVWVGNSRYLIVLAFVASFLQQQVWQTIGQIGEAERKTVLVQLLGLAVVCFNLLGILILQMSQCFDVDIILFFYSGEYIIFTILGIWFLRINKLVLVEREETEPTLREIAYQYITYCRPLIFLTLGLFFYDFLDKWMLQQFGGSAQQGYYQIANQFAAISLLATTSILNVFWKEIANANEQNDNSKMAHLYQRATRGLVMFGAALSGFLIPWTRQIILIFLGDTYLSAVPVLALMFVYPIHQAIGQINGVMFLACGRTKMYSVLGMVNMFISIPISYFIQAPSEDVLLPGLNLGAMGMAVKMVVLQVGGVNLAAWLIAKSQGWNFEWKHQFVAIALACFWGYVSHWIVVTFLTTLFMNFSYSIQFVVFLLSGAILYFPIIVAIALVFPWLLGLQPGEIRTWLNLKMRL